MNDAATAKYFAAFEIPDREKGGTYEFQGVIELSRPVSEFADRAEIIEILENNLIIEAGELDLKVWERLH